MLLLSSTCSLRKLRNLCSRLNKRLSQSHGTITEKNLHISQLEDAVKHLGAKVETTTEEAEKKSKDVAELHLKLNENYRLVAELSSDNLRYVLWIGGPCRHGQPHTRTPLKLCHNLDLIVTVTQ